jgi:peptide deformylase
LFVDARPHGVLNVTTRPIVTVQDRNPVLRSAARPVRRLDRATRQLMDEMIAIMRDAPGVGLAAPQVGVGVRVIVVETPLDTDDAESDTRVWALADPEIVWSDLAMVEDQEACLSVPGLYGDVARHTRIRVRAIERSGRRVEIDADGFEARVIQHEIDHLDGVLFIDRVASIDKLYTLRDDGKGERVRVPYRPPVPVG